MKITFFSKKRLITILAVLLTGIAPIWAESKTANFNSGLPEGWSLVGDVTNADDRARTGKGLFSYSQSSTANYVITEEVQGTFEFYARAYNKNKNSYVVVYEYNGTELGQQLYTTVNMKTSSTPTWSKYSLTLSNSTQLAIALNYAAIDDATYTPAEAIATARLEIAGQASGSTYNFGGTPVKAGTTHTFTLANKGSETLTIEQIAVTGDYAITEGADLASIEARQQASLTIATPEKDATGVLTISSNDPDSPYTILLSSTLKVPAPVMGIDKTAVAFGKVTENATYKIGVSNTGDANLTASITSDHTQFTVIPASLTIEPNKTDSFNITFNYNAEAYGMNNGIITVTPNAGDPVQIAVSAKVLDPNAWTEDFNSNTLPQGWEVSEQCWTFADGVAKASYGSYNDGYKHYLTTPALEVAAGDELEFQAKSTGTYTTIKILASKDGGNFTSYKSIDLENNMTEFETYTISGLAAGTYMFRFANDNYELDNFYGMKRKMQDHSAQITATNIAANGTQYLSYTATTSVKEVAGKDETLTVRFYIGEQQIGNEIVETVEAYSTKTFTLTFTPDEAISGEAYFTVSNDYIELNTAKTQVNIQAAPTLNENSGSLEGFENWGSYEVVALQYTLTSGWNTIILPFATSTTLFGKHAQAYELESANANDLKFKSVSSMNAMQPYILLSDTTASVLKFFNIKNLRTACNAEDLQTKKNNVVFQGTYAPAEAGSLANSYVLATKMDGNPTFVKATAETTMPGFRAYMTLPKADMNIYLDDISTGIQSMRHQKADKQTVFNLNGQRVAKPAQTGIYITNGKKVIVR